jgi:MoxR-like ATPase
MRDGLSDADVAGSAERLAAVLREVKTEFVGKDEIVDLLGVAMVARENLFLLGPPGTAKSALVQALARRLGGKTFDYLLTRFTEPNELFGPFDIGRLREGELVTNTDGMLPEASLVFLDELLNANSAILNSLLMVLNERVFRRGRETWELPTLMVVGASNHLPEDAALAALFDRFLLRVNCDNVTGDRLGEVLSAGWALESSAKAAVPMISVEEVRQLQGALASVSMVAIAPAYLALIERFRHAGIAVSDRRAVKLQRVVAGSAILCGRRQATTSDLWVLRYAWDREEQQEVMASLVKSAIEREPEAPGDHPRSRDDGRPDPEALARDLRTLADSAGGADSATERERLREQASLLAARIEWVGNDVQRGALQEQLAALWQQLGAKAAD